MRELKIILEMGNGGLISIKEVAEVLENGDIEEDILINIDVKKAIILYDGVEVYNRWERLNLTSILEYSDRLYKLCSENSMEHLLAYLENEGGDLEDAIDEFQNRSTFWGNMEEEEDIAKDFFMACEGEDVLERVGKFIDWDKYLDSLLDDNVIYKTSYGFIEIYD